MEFFSAVISLTLVGALAWTIRRMARRSAERRRNVPEQFFGAAGDESLLAESRTDTHRRQR